LGAVSLADRPPDEAALAAFCRSRLAPYKVPAAFEFVAEFPRTPAGKITGWVAPRSRRAAWKPRTEPARPWTMVASDHSEAKTRKLRRVPMRSTTHPPTRYMTVYASRKADVMSA